MARKPLLGFLSGPLSAAEPIREFAEVVLTHDLEYRGTLYPKGTRGVVVYRHNVDAYEVEFDRPEFGVITVSKGDIVVV